MKKFVIRFLPFLLIGIVYASIGEYFLSELKENVSIEEVTELQKNSDKELYYGRQVLGNSISNYKVTMFRKKQPEVMTLGQSVTLQFRDFMFEPFEQDFYNTGLMSRNLKDIEYVTRLFETGEVKTPKFIFFATDLSLVLNPSFLDKQEFTRTPPTDRATESRSHLKGIQKVYLSAALRRPPEEDFGFGKAGMEGKGYRNDGTYRHKPNIEKFIEEKGLYNDGELSEKLEKKVIPFLLPMKYDNSKEKRLLEILDRLRQLNIELLLYIPPYSDTFFEKAKKDVVFMSFWKEYMNFQQKLIELDYDVIPFTTPGQMGLEDNYMVDAEHPSEVFCAIQLRNYVKNSGTTNPFLKKLTFIKVDKLLSAKTTIPIAFLVDDASASLREQVIESIH